MVMTDFEKMVYMYKETNPTLDFKGKYDLKEIHNDNFDTVGIELLKYGSRLISYTKTDVLFDYISRDFQ